MPKTQRNCYECALKLLSYRAHTTRELNTKLLKRRFSETEIKEAVSKLKTYNMLNDGAFADYFVKSRSERLLGENAIKSQLLNKGVDHSIIEDTLHKNIDSVSELEKAKKLSAKFLAAHKKLASNEKTRKLAYYLLRKGYAGGIVYKVTKIDTENEN